MKENETIRINIIDEIFRIDIKVEDLIELYSETTSRKENCYQVTKYKEVTHLNLILDLLDLQHTLPEV